MGTLKKEFGEEALNSLQLKEDELKEAKEQINKFFEEAGKEVFKGYVYDPRNTDNSWIETMAYNFHDETGEITKHFRLAAGDDANAVRWMRVDRNLDLYASHNDLLKKVAEMHNAFF